MQILTSSYASPLPCGLLAWAFRRWRSAPLSTPYPSTTSESSLGSSFERSLDSSSPSSRPSRKKCRSPTASVPSPTHVLRPIAPTPWYRISTKGQKQGKNRTQPSTRLKRAWKTEAKGVCILMG
ncbi:hypothetical protein Tco_1389110 [Tanacetum coccineum]